MKKNKIILLLYQTYIFFLRPKIIAARNNKIVFKTHKPHNTYTLF